MKVNSIIYLSVFLTSLASWLSVKSDMVKTEFFIGKVMKGVDTNLLDESVRMMVDRAGLDNVDAHTPSDEEIDKMFVLSSST